jgi:lipopolysaccharide transport system ATP-binding protein
MLTAVSIEQLSKSYRLGTISHRLLYRDLQSWWARRRGREDPNAMILDEHHPGQTGDIFWALKEISFDVRQGDIVGIIGKNGAGKSTLLKILSRITSPTEGCAKLKGRVSSLLEVGTGFHKELTGRENIYLNGAILGMSKPEINRKLDAIVEFAGTTQFVDTPVKRYSSGMLVRLGFSVAAHLDSEILLVDEVLAVGDAAFKRKCMNRMQETSRSGRTVLLVSHNMMQIRRICNNAVWIDKGRICLTGPARDVTLAYEKKVTRRADERPRTCFTREGSHYRHVWIKRVTVNNAKGEPCAEFEYGDDIVLDIELSYGPDFAAQKLHDIGLVWILNDEGDVRISADSMVHHMTSIPDGKHNIRCVIRSIPLYKGTYKMDLGITQESGRLDTWNDALYFNVIYCDPVGQGFERDRRSGYVHINTAWQT